MGLNPKNPARTTVKKTVIDPFISKESLLAEAAETQIGKAMKGSTLEFEGDIATQGIDTDQIKKAGGEGPQSFDTAFLETAGNITSKRQKESNAIANFEAKQAAIKASKIEAIEKNEITKEMKSVIQEKQKLNEEQANEKLLKFADAQEELDHLESKTLWEKTKDFFSTFATPMPTGTQYGLMALGAKNLIYGGMNAKEEKRYNELQNFKKKEIDPVLDITSTRIDERYKTALEKADVLRQQKLQEDAMPMLGPDGSVGPRAGVKNALGKIENTSEDNYTPYEEEIYWRVTASKYEDMKEKISDYRTGNTDFFAGLSTTSKDVFSLGIKPLRDDIKAKQIVDKRERIYAAQKKGQVPTESLSDAENAVLEAYGLEAQVQQLKLHENNFGYNLGEGVGGSLGFMAQMILTRGAGATAKQAVSSAFRQGLKQDIKLGLRSLIKENIKKGTLSSLTKTGTELTIRSTAATAGILAQAPISPFFYKAYASDQVGQVEIVKDKNGVEKILVGQELYDEKSQYYKEQLQALDQLIQRETDPAKREEFESKKLHLQAEWDSMIPKSEVSSLMHATGEYFKEAFSEAYAGRGLGAAFKQSGKGLRYMTAKSPFLTKVADNFGIAGEVLAKVNSPFRKINNAVNNLTLGRISAAQIGQKAEGGLIQSIPEETFEEIFVQAVPSLGRTSAENQVQREELGNLSFYRDVMAQTAIMGLGFGFVGKVAAAKAYARDKTDYKKLLKSLSLTDEEQKALGFTTGNKLVSPKDYRRLSAQFREQGKDAIADQIEQRMFINMAYQAARLGKMDSYKQSIEALKTRKDIPVSFITNAVAISNQIESINNAYQKHSEKENFNEILEATVYQGLHEDNLKKLESQTSFLQENARLAIEDYKARTGKSFDYSIDNLLTKEFENEEEQKQYKQILGELLDEETGSLAVQNLVGNIEMKRAARIAISENAQKLDLALSSKRQERLEAKKLLREEYELIEKDLESGDIVLPRVELEFDYNNNLQKKSLASVNVAEAIIKHIEENYKDVVNQEDLQELKMQKIEKAKALRENAMAELLIAQSQKIEDKNQINFEDSTQPQDPFNSSYDIAPDPDKYEDDTELPVSAVNSDPILDQVFGLASQGFQADSPEVTVSTPSVNPQGAIQMDQDGFIFDGEPMIGKVYPSEFVDEMERLLESSTQLYEESTNSRITFKDIFEYYKSNGTHQNMKKNFGAMMQAWTNLNAKHGDKMYPMENFLETFNSIYSPKAVFDILDIDPVSAPIPVNQGPVMPTNHPDIEVRQENEKIAETTLVSSVIVGQDDSNRDIVQEKIEITIDGHRTSNVLPKIGYSSLEYTEQNVDGTYTKVSIPILNPIKSNGVDITSLIDPDGLQTGDTLSIEIADEKEWKDITVSNGRDSNGIKQLTTFDKWVSEKEKSNPNFRSTQEFQNKLPIYYTYQGKRVGSVNDTDWYDGYNVQDPNGLDINPHRPTGEWAEVIAEGKQNTQALRDNILNKGLKEVTIKKAPSSVVHRVENDSLVTIADNNPTSILVVQIGEEITIGNREPFKEGIILNEDIFKERTVENGKNKLTHEGKTWELRREGKKQMPDGTFVNTYRAWGVSRRVTEEQLETVKWALGANAVLSNSYLTNATEWTSLTKDQAEAIKEEILNNTTLDISLPNELLMFVESYLQLKDKPKRGAIKENGKPYTTYMYYQDQFLKNNLGIDSEGIEYVQHTKQELLNKRGYKSAVHILNGQVVLLNMSYSDYLKNTLKTDVLSFNIGTETKPIYVTGIQPIINITYTSIQENPKTEAETIVEKVVETPVTETVDFTEQYEFAASLNLDIDSYLEFEEGEAMLANNLDPIQKLVTSIAGLTTPQEQAVRQYVTQAIAEYKQYIDEEGRVLKRNKKQIQAEAKNKLLTNLAQVKQALENNLSIVKSTDTDSAEKRAFEKAYSEALSNINSIESQFNVLFERALEDFERSSKTEIEEDVEDPLNEKNYNKDSVEENSKLSVGTVLKNFLHGIVKRDSKGVPQTGYLGIEQYYTFNEIFNELTKLLTLGSDLPSSYEALASRLKNAAENGAPFAKDVLLKLENADNQTKNQFLYTFVKHSMSSYFTMYQEVGNVSEMKSFETNANEATRVIENKWKNNNRTSELYNRNLSLNTKVAQELLDTYNNWITEGNSSPTQHREWLSKLGVSFTDAAWDKIVAEGIKDKGYTYDNILYDDSRGIFKPIADFLANALVTPDNFMFSEDKNIFKNLSAMFKSVAKIEASYNTSLVSLTYRDGDKNIFTQTPETFMSNKVNDLLDSLAQENNTLIDDLRSLSFSESSIILEFLQEVKSFKNIFKMSHAAIVTLKERGEEASDRSSITDLGELDYDLNVNGQFGDRKIKQLTTTEKINGIPVRIMRMLCPTMSDKSKAYYLDTVGLDLLQSNALIESGKEDIVMSEKLKEVLVDKLIMPEVNRILNYYNKVKQTNIKDYDEGATKFHLIPALNTLKNKDGISILTELATVPNLTSEIIKANYGNVFKEIVTNVIDAEVNKKKELWKDQFVEGVGSRMFGANYFTEVKKSPVKDYYKGIYDVVINGMLHNSEMFKVFAGDMALYSQAKLYKIETESSKANTSENKVSEYKDIEDFTTEDWVSINRAIGVNLGKRLAALAAPGNKIADSANPNFRQYNQIFLQDSVDIAPNASYLITLEYGKEALTPKVKTMLSDYSKHADTVHQYQIGNTLDVNEVSKAQSAMKEIRSNLQKMFPAVDSYFDIESTDAQEYTTVREHINILNRQGRLTDKKLKAIEEKLAAGKDLTREELKVVMQPIKPVHTGSYANKDMDVNRFVYIKSSSYPLLPQFTKGTKLDGLRVKMEELERDTKRFTRASFQTANKVGSVNTKLAINPFDMYSLATIKESNTDAVVVLDRNNFRIQQDVPIKSEKTKADKISMGTQFFKLLFGDGITDLDGFEIDGQKFTGRELHKYYTEAFADLAKQKRIELFNELGLSSNGEIEDKKEFIYNLQKLLIKEAKSRGYSLKSIAGLSIDELAMANGYFYEFKTPLWLSSDKNRYESLLNSIVTNRLMQYKIPGNAYVAGSESGIQFKEGIDSIKDLDQRTQSRVIYLDNFNGKELGGTEVVEEDGSVTFKKAQVFIRSYFKNPATGELIDLFEGYNNETGDTSNAKYLIRRENGTLGLKEGMIDQNLFNMFSFRTPTSSHVSGSSIEIAGILPPEMGELMIVPKNFTKQKGLDFDIDKENTYQLNHYIDEEGNIKEVNEEYKIKIEASLKELRFYKRQDYASLREAEEVLTALDAKLKVATNIPYKNELLAEIDLLWLSLKDTKANIKDINYTMKSIQRELDTKIASQLSENKFIKAHLAVFNNPDNKVQRKINKVLSMSFAQDQASMFEKAVEEGNKAKEIAKYVSLGMSPIQAEKEYFNLQSYNTVLSYSYQKMKMDLGSIGKTAIGVYANYTTMNGLIQQQTETISLNQPITIGGATSTGKLGVLESLKPSNISQSLWDKMKLGRSTAEIFAEKENTATDNEKEQILGRVGVNDQTINVDALLTLLGFDIDLVKISGVKEFQKMSLSYLLLSQPSIKEYNKKIKDSQGLLGEFLNKNALKKEMVERLSENTITFGKDPNKSSLDKDNRETFRYVATGEVYTSGSLLTGQNMYDSISKIPNGLVQAEALITYLNLDTQAREVSKVQKILNTNDLGKSMVESRVTYEALADLPLTSIKNATSLLGKFEANPEIITDEMYKIGGYYVTPTTPQGHIAIHGLQVGNTLFKNFFPYDDAGIKSIVNQILTSQGLNIDTISDKVYVKEFHKIMEEMIKYINSNPSNNTFIGNAREKRLETFVDSDTNTSLSTYLRDLGNSTTNRKGINAVLKNALYSRFSFTTGVEGELSLIKYNNTSTDNLDEEVLYNALPELILANYPLPNRNGKPYSTRQLAEDLVAYSFLEGGVQEATQFSKFIPVQLLEVMGQIENRNGKEMFVPINKKLQMFNNRNNTVGFFNSILGVKEYDIASFTRQYFQNNSKKAKKAWGKNVTFSEEGVLFYETKQGKSPKFITHTTVEDNKKITKLYENVGGKAYKQLDIVGQSGIKEYYYKQDQVTSLFNEENTIEVPASIMPPTSVLDSLTITNLTTPEDLLAQIQTMNFGKDRKYLAETAKWLIPLLKTGKVTVRLSDTLPNGIMGHTSRPDSKGQIVISLSSTQMDNLSRDKGAELILHEVLHSVAVSHLTEYFDSTGMSLKSEVAIPAHVQGLYDAFNAARVNYEDEIAELEEKIAHNSIKSNPQLPYTEREMNVIYGLTNIFEFVSVSMTSEDFQKEFKDAPFDANKSIFNKIEDFILGMLDNFFPDLKKNTIARQSILASMNFIQEERVKVAPKTQVQPVIPSANVGVVYGKYIEISLNERVTQRLPKTLTLEKGLSVDTQTLLGLSQLKQKVLSGEFFDWAKYDTEDKEVNDEELEQAIEKEYGPAALEYVQNKWLEDSVSLAEIEFLKDNPAEGAKIVEAWYNLSEERTISDFADRLLKEIPEEFVDKNQTKLFEEGGDAMISNNLLTFDTSIEALGISEEEWNTLSIEEKDRILKCS